MTSLSRNSRALLALALLALLPTPAHAVIRCKTREPSASERSGVDSHLREFTHRERRDLSTQPLLEMPVVFNVIHSGTTGKLTQAACQAQIDVLNNAFAGKTHAQGVDVRVRFKLNSVNYIDNAVWYGEKCYDLDTQFKNAHTRDPTRFLNIFTCSGSGLLGWSTLPQDYGESSKLHAVVVAWKSLPGQGLAGYDQGDTATHEIGHFLGLLHTFSNGACSESSGDGVDDTPLEKSSASGCPTTRDSCPNSPGLDPVWNFMDYSTDSCMNRFTLGQANRMRNMIALHKPQFVKNSIVTSSSTAASTTTTTTTKAATTTATTTTKAGTAGASSSAASTTKTTATTTTTKTTATTTTTKATTTTTTTTTKATTTTTKPSTASVNVVAVTSEFPTTALGNFRSTRSCADLGWDPVREGVCASSGSGLSCFGLSVTYQVAEATCLEMGARLCTDDEILGGLANPKKSQRCKAHLSKRFWTQSECGNGKYYALGQNFSAPGRDEICLQSSGKINVMCCADQ